MGINDDTPTVHENINTSYATFTASPDLRMRDIYFYGGTDKTNNTYLILTEEGKLVLGDGLSLEEATQSAAKMLAEYYGFEITKKIQELQEELNKRTET